ncbi:MAG: hypothetical protein DI629_17800 [Mesorhizobium amorphae]|nr:MAG: hypothetical protein DI629_17800 [Mesorhizobium amorphae]
MIQCVIVRVCRIISACAHRDGDELPFTLLNLSFSSFSNSAPFDPDSRQVSDRSERHPFYLVDMRNGLQNAAFVQLVEGHIGRDAGQACRVILRGG